MARNGGGWLKMGWSGNDCAGSMMRYGGYGLLGLHGSI